MRPLTPLVFLAGLPAALSLPTTSASNGNLDIPNDMIRRDSTTPDGKSITLLLHNSLTSRSGLTRRVNYPGAQPNAFMGNQCGDSTFDSTANADFPAIQDCSDLATGLDGMDRHWALSNGGGAGVPEWQDLVSNGNCHFYVNRKNFPDITVDGRVLVGTQDIADIVRDVVSRYSSYSTVSWGGGSIQVSHIIPAHGSMYCQPYVPQEVPWRVQANQP
ncbi:uncharacterized protein BDR25DRAFT_308577 [Lindgomyces ingoldianus]|uniref:Uncharacterized protein n=1 Tax=Lindgomyces ingoldianus TaxID=673940 RepID=A0ACB6REG1_9PLEO|nr:uncharacterized protein BDR25DRAFT_308577 [Lindgomyces ingoldianus]KAF2477693.1 hypothetical protein BDR25DRAFT_308577 [Lindgomyces ingoldianus]